jgi:hypothetical protein
MDWTFVVKKNRLALSLIVAEIFALLGIIVGGSVEHVSQTIYMKVERLLHPMESALRRLIMVAARDLIVKPLPKRPLPLGLKFERKPSGRMTFRLFDKCKKFDFNKPTNPIFVLVKTYSNNPFNLFNNPFPRCSEKEPNAINATQLCRRLASVQHAHEILPHLVRRIARWQAQWKLMEKPNLTSPLRPGPPPRHRAKPKAEIDYVLQGRQSLACDVLRGDTS